MSEKSPVESNLKSAEYLTFGGMAVVEGVMMRSPNYWAVACRAPNGKIVVKTEPLEKTWIGRQKWLKAPFLRGSLAILDTMALGTRAMNFAAGVQTEEKHLDPAEAASVKKTSKATDNFVIGLTILVSLVIGFFVFKAAPEVVAEFSVRTATGQEANRFPLATNYIAEVIKILLFIGYLGAISRIPTIYEVFKYHGAEHKAINTVEAHVELNAANCAAQTRLHPRCGTNFAIIVAIVTFLIVPLIPRDLIVPLTAPGWLLAASRILVDLLVLPFVAGISYEVIRAAGKAKEQKWVNVLLAPGLATQFITTAEPEQAQIEVAIASLEAVMDAEDTGELLNTDDYHARAAVPSDPAPANA
ncbi:MAG: DUF1385 domain-containing protein [Fimbriimonadaceae bacterium]|nr:DUF1385 domain-containing protein [Fimbriimonadaceae bacterium]QYK55406.1 MAG: DUF1385 domain-containing protein [Fimbriimonadaceae bacterium]